jgi:hypothetical protein
MFPFLNEPATVQLPADAHDTDKKVSLMLISLTLLGNTAGIA